MTGEPDCRACGLCCVALRGSLLKRVRCSVYDRRPEACREAIRPGDRVCLDVRRMTFEGCGLDLE